MTNEMKTRCTRCGVSEVVGADELLAWLDRHKPGVCDAPSAPAPVEARRYEALDRATATHRIEQDVFVCDGGPEARCHWWPDCDEETFPCEHDYVSHGDDCWILGWLNATVPVDNDLEEGERRDDDGHYPDGLIAWQWEDEYILWTYATDPTALAVDTKEGHRA